MVDCNPLETPPGPSVNDKHPTRCRVSHIHAYTIIVYIVLYLVVYTYMYIYMAAIRLTCAETIERVAVQHVSEAWKPCL